MARHTDTIPLLDPRQIGNVVRRLAPYRASEHQRAMYYPYAIGYEEVDSRGACLHEQPQGTEYLKWYCADLHWTEPQQTTRVYKIPRETDVKTGNMIVLCFVHARKAQEADETTRPIFSKLQIKTLLQEKNQCMPMPKVEPEQPAEQEGTSEGLDYEWSKRRHRIRAAARAYSEQTDANY